MSIKAPIILAVDTSDLDLAKSWIAHTSEHVSVFKLGLEFFLNFGQDGIRAVTENSDARIFLDLKLHDIPNTVAHAAESVASLNPLFLTVHASGGAKMISAAAKELPDTHITAVTVLTSLDDIELKSMGNVLSSLEMAVNLARIAEAAGARPPHRHSRRHGAAF